MFFNKKAWICRISITILVIGSKVLVQSFERVNNNLLAFYDFRIVNGALVKDRSKIGPPLDLKIENLQNVQRSSGGLKVIGNTICLLYTSPSPRDQRGSRMPCSA